MPSLTPKQKQVLDFVHDYYERHEYSPSLKEIAKKFKKSVPTIHQHVQSLIRKGYLNQDKGTPRGITPVLKDPSSFTPPVSRRRVRIGIIGYGIVGQAVAYGFSNEEIHVYDKYKESESLEDVVDSSDFLFLCLPTPIKSDESGIDLAIIDEIVGELAPMVRGSDKVIILKSTVVPGTTHGYAKKYKKCLFCFNPEFLTERSFLQDFINSDRVILGTENSQVFRRVSSVYQTIMPNTPIFQTDPTTAEMIKYMANCFLASKVIFANEMHDICEKLRINYDEVKTMVAADSRIHDSHLDVTTLRGFGGKCFPKDLLALKAVAKKMGADTTILEATWKKNLKIRKVHDWDEIPFAVSKKFGHRG